MTGSAPTVGELDRARGLALFAAGRDWEASRALASARSAGASDAETLRKLGFARFAVGDAAGAEASMREALAAAPRAWESHYGLGAVLRGRDDRAAMVAFGAALKLAPGNVECLLALSSGALAERDANAAEGYARRALASEVDRRDAWAGLGIALLAQDRLCEALAALQGCEGLSRKEERDRCANLDRGLALRLLGRTRESIDFFECRLPQWPDATAHGQYALALLLAGEFCGGWEQYEFRWFDAALAAQRASYDRPRWSGEDLRGKTILLRCEQGIGDVLQFIRYAPLVKARGAKVLLELRPGLEGLAGTLPGIDAPYEHGKVDHRFDCWCDLMSLPLAFGTTLDAIPAEVPYLRVAEARRTQWRERLTGVPGLRAGIVWAGDPRHPRDRQRSVPLHALHTLFAIEGVRWYSLQKGPAAAALGSIEPAPAVTDLDRDLVDYADTAAAIEVLDLVVTVDTSVAHLAGALGKQVWVLLPDAADWRWLEDRDDSPWYPTMRLFRQRCTGDWCEVVSRVAAAIRLLLDSHAVAATESPGPKVASQGVSSCSRRHPGRPDVPSVGIARACFTRVGWMQYLPSANAHALSIEHYGEYLQAQVALLQRVVLRDAVIVEFGTGIGYHAIALAALAGNDGQVLAVESSSAVQIMLRQNVDACAARGLSIMPSGAADSWVDALDFTRLDLLKTNEPAVGGRFVDNAARTLWKLRPAIFAAQPTREALDALATRVIDFGYRCWCVDTPLFDPANFNRRTGNIFGDKRALALLALPEERDFVLPEAGIAQITSVTT